MNSRQRLDMTTRRLKTYSAQSGYVYEYYFVGKREALPGTPETPSTEYVFDVSSGRGAVYAVSVFLGPDALDAWAQSHGRPLTGAEQYAAAKLRLLRGFDEIQSLATSSRRWAVTADSIEELLADLGLDQ